jgi:uncharacterized protein
MARFVFTFCLMFTLLLPAAFADQASKEAKAEEYFRLMKMDRMLEQQMLIMTQQFKSGYLQQVMGLKVPPEQEKEMQSMMDKMSALVTNALSWEKLKPDFVKIYAEAFTETQLEEMIAFYKSPTGQAMVEKSPELMRKGSEISQKRMVDLQAEIQKLIRESIQKATQAPQPR